MLDKMPAYEVNGDGAFREWLYPGLKDNYHHRHLSHIYPLFPGFEINRENNPDLFEAIRVAVKKRLIIGLCDQTGWSLAHQANIYARLESGDEALECLELLCQVCVGPNLFTYHNDYRSMGITLYWGHGSKPPFQIDANFGFTAAVLEMLFSSAPGLVKLLPALPKDWTSGRLMNVLCRGGITLSVQWNQKTGSLWASLTSAATQEITLKLPWKFGKIHAPECILSPSTLGAQYRTVLLEAGKTVEIVGE